MDLNKVAEVDKSSLRDGGNKINNLFYNLTKEKNTLKTNCVIEVFKTYAKHFLKKDPATLDRMHKRMIGCLEVVSFKGFNDLPSMHWSDRNQIVKEELGITLSAPQSWDDYDFKWLLKAKIAPFFDDIQTPGAPKCIDVAHIVLVVARIGDNIYFYSDGKPLIWHIEKYLSFRTPKTITLAEKTLKDILEFREAIINKKSVEGKYIFVPGANNVAEVLKGKNFNLKDEDLKGYEKIIPANKESTLSKDG